MSKNPLLIRFLSILLCAVLVFALVPASAAAAVGTEGLSPARMHTQTGSSSHFLLWSLIALICLCAIVMLCQGKGPK